MSTETLTGIRAELTVRQDVPDEAAEAGFEPDDFEVDWWARVLDAEAARAEVQKVLDGGTVNYDLGRGRFLRAVLDAEFRAEDGTPRSVVLCEWTSDEGWAPPATPPPVEVLLAAHHRPATTFETQAHEELLFDLHAGGSSNDGRAPAWCAECAEGDECGYSAVVNELGAL